MPERAPISLGPYACSREEILAIRRGTITTIVGPATFLGVGGKQRRSGWYRARPGDFIWTQEPTKEFICRGHEEHRDTIYEADFKGGFGSPKIKPLGRRGFKQIMVPPHKMHRYLSRTTLEIVGKSFGNVWDISADDALFCGIKQSPFVPYDYFEYVANGGCSALRHQHAFVRMFWQRYGTVPSGENPPYIALAFKVHEKNIGEMLPREPEPPKPEHDPDANTKAWAAFVASATIPNHD